MNERDHIQNIVQRLVALLVQRQYRDAELLTNGVRLDAREIADAIAEYGRTLVVLPDDAWRLMETTAIRNSLPRKWSVVIPLWTHEEGRSDLSIECTAIERDEAYALELDDIHVL